MVQLPSIWICEGGLGVTLPSSTPPRSATQRSSARAETALSSNSAKGNSRILIQLPRSFVLFVSLEVIYALVPLIKRFRRYRDRGSHTVDWISAVPPSWGLGPLDR